MDSLLSVKPESGSDYEHVWRRVHEVEGAAERIDRMWHELRPYVDSNFAREFRAHPYERSWELILGSTLLQRGFQLVTKTPSGPDFKIADGDRFVWIEATAPTSGSGPDRIPAPPPNAMFDYPERQVVLRIRGAIEVKLRQFDAFARGGSVGPNDCFVVAVNGMQFNTLIDFESCPAILKAVLPAGAPQVLVNQATGDVVEGPMEYRPAVQKDSGSEVSTTCFLDPAYSDMSAVLFSEANFLMDFEWVNRYLTVVHNPLAARPLPHGWFGFGSEIVTRIHDDRVSWTFDRLDPDESG